MTTDSISTRKRPEKQELLGRDNSGNGSEQDEGGRIVPPDGGWGWMVVLSSFMIHVIADGIVYSFGVFLMEFVVYFRSGRSAASLIGALQPAVTFTVGPLASVLTNRYGCRKVTIAGALIAAAGFLTSAFAPHLYYLYFTSGIMAGVGFGLIYLPAIVCVAQYFKKRRSFATGLAVCGSGFGTFILAPVIEMLVHRFSWQGAMLILSGIILHVTVCGIIFRPLKARGTGLSPDPEGDISSISADLENSCARESKYQRCLLEVEESTVTERSNVEKCPKIDVSTDSPVLTSSQVVNCNNSLQWVRTGVSDKTTFGNDNNCSSSNNHPSRSAMSQGLDETSRSPDTGNTSNNVENSTSSGNEIYRSSGGRLQTLLAKLRSTRGHRTRPSQSLGHVFKSQNKQISPVEPRCCQSDVYLGQSIQTSASGERQDSLDTLSDRLTTLGSNESQDRDSLSETRKNQGYEDEESRDVLSDLGNNPSMEPRPQSREDSVHQPQLYRCTPSESCSRQNSLSLPLEIFQDTEDVSKHLERSSTLSEKHTTLGSLSGGEHDQNDLVEQHVTQSFVSDPSSTRDLLSQHHPLKTSTSHSDSILHLQVALRYKLRAGVLAQRCKSHSCLVAYKPLRHRDILYSNALKNIPLFRPRQDTYTATVTSVPDHVILRFREKRQQKYGECLEFSRDLRGAVREMMSLTLLRNNVFLMFAASNFLTSLGFNVPFIFLPDRAKLAGIDEKSAALLLSWIGIANTLGRIAFGFLSDRPWVNRLMLYNTALTICGVLTALSPLVGGHYALLVTYASVFGVFIGVYVSLTSIVLVDLLGLEYLTNSFGLLLLFQGAATFVGPPFAGWLCDVTGSYDTSFVVMGCLVAASGAMLYFLPLVQRCQVPRLNNPNSDPESQPGKQHTHSDDRGILSS